MPKKFHFDFETKDYTTEGPVTIADTTDMAIALAAESLYQGNVKPEKLEESADMIAKMIVGTYKKLVEKETAND